jgi:CRP/FNR family transcriptional regulator
VTNCLPGGLDAAETAGFEQIIAQQRRLETGQQVFRIGDPFRSLFAIQTGHLKTSVLDVQGREHVLNFHLPGEIIGVDAIYLNRYVTTAIALTPATVCELPFEELRRFGRGHTALEARMFSVFSRAAFHMDSLAVDSTVAERLAAFLLGLLARSRARGQQQLVLELAMDRSDIANHLRVAPETVSRELTKFHKDGLLEVEGKQITVRNLERLRQLASTVNPYAW